ncbi:MAG: hypothetical protein ACE5HB_07420, partial [Terriglobia bacterium]
ARELKKALKDMERRLWVPPGTKGIVGDTDVLSKVSFLLRAFSSSWEAPTDAQLTYLRQADALAQEVFADFNRLFDEQVAAFRRQVQEAGIELLPPREPLALSQE